MPNVSDNSYDCQKTISIAYFSCRKVMIQIEIIVTKTSDRTVQIIYKCWCKYTPQCRANRPYGEGKDTIFQLQCSLDIATDLRHQGWGRYKQRGAIFKDISLKNVESSTLKHKPLDIATSKQLTVAILLHKSWNLQLFRGCHLCTDRGSSRRLRSL